MVLFIFEGVAFSKWRLSSFLFLHHLATDLKSRSPVQLSRPSRYVGLLGVLIEIDAELSSLIEAILDDLDDPDGHGPVLEEMWGEEGAGVAIGGVQGQKIFIGNEL